MYKIIFMDINMPVMNGFETSKEILWIIWEAKILNLPKIYAVTALEGVKDHPEWKDSGIINYIHKPVWDEDIESIL